jgi:hypothetical protein
MRYGPPRKHFQRLVKKVRQLLKRRAEPPDDPYSYVGAPKKPRPSRGSAAVAEPLD